MPVYYINCYSPVLLARPLNNCRCCLDYNLIGSWRNECDSNSFAVALFFGSISNDLSIKSIIEGRLLENSDFNLWNWRGRERVEVISQYFNINRLLLVILYSSLYLIQIHYLMMILHHLTSYWDVTTTHPSNNNNHLLSYNMWILP